MSEEATSAPPRPAPSVRQLVLGAATLMIVAQLAFRAWALYPSWFYLDDFGLLDDAEQSGVGPAALLEPYDSQLMPLGRLLAGVVASSPGDGWAVAASITLILQAVASAACVWMLLTLFGARWSVLPLLAFYLYGAITVPATMWWAASLNALPLQIAFFVAVGAWTHHLRGRRLRWLLVVLAALGLGLLAYAKALLLLPFLAVYALAWFGVGRSHRTVTGLLRRHWPALVAVTALGAGYLVYYREHVPPLTAQPDLSLAVDLADSMLGTALAPGLLGGPWAWSQINPPVGLAEPPSVAAHLSWVVLALVIAFSLLRRLRAGRAWLLLGGYVAGSYVLLLTTRAPVVGGVVGLEYRYLTDVACAATLCLGLAFLPLDGAPGSSADRTLPLLRLGVSSRAVALVTALVVASGSFSSWRYVQSWHDENRGEQFLRATQQDLAGRGSFDVADTVVPAAVVPGYLYPLNTTARLLPLVVQEARFPSVSDRLLVLGPDGRVSRAAIAPATTSRPGPVEDCGWQVRESGRTIPMTGTAFDFTWWIRISYLGSVDDEVTVTVGDLVVTAPVQRGPHSLYVEVTSEVSSVTLDGLSTGTTLCVDTVEVGNVVPGGTL